jgi:hypothetical protein
MLLQEFGPVIGGLDLCRAMGLVSMDAFRQAEARGQMPIAIFTIPHRRGKFALSADLAQWLADLRCSRTQNESSEAE